MNCPLECAAQSKSMLACRLAVAEFKPWDAVVVAVRRQGANDGWLHVRQAAIAGYLLRSDGLDNYAEPYEVQ